MHLSRLRLARFRSFEEMTLPLRDDLTVLIGENNGGKSNVIDALRLLTLPLNGRRDRYAEEEDVRRLSEKRSFELEAHFKGLSETIKGLLVRAVPDPTKDEAVFGLRYEEPKQGVPRGCLHTWVGKFEEAEPESKSTDLIRHVYLPPMRDAQAVLGSGSAGRVMGLFRHFIPKDREDEFLRSVSRPKTPSDMLDEINSVIGEALIVLTSGVRPQKSNLGFNDEALVDVARDLRFRLADAGIPLGDIRQSGLGYANLLYLATVAAELTKAREADLTIFLVEEPEAHLHPQLQMLVLDFLLNVAQESQKRPVQPGEPEGRIQVVVTTHSPNLTAWVDPERLVVLRTGRGPSSESSSPRTVCVPLGELLLDPKVIGKLNRYLDVTRSALLFGNRALLVEGVAEALLLPVIARFCVLRNDKEAWRRFKGTALVPIEGVDFKPYVEVLLKPHEGSRIADRVVVITDADPSVPGNRKDDLETLALKMQAGEVLKVLTNIRTLEFDLFNAGNEEMLKTAFLALHSHSANDWEDEISAAAKNDRAEAFLNLLLRKRTRKGDFAQAVADQISASPLLFSVPDYLRQAILAVSTA